MDDNQRVYIMIHDPITEGHNCPSNFLWSSTAKPRIRVLQQGEESAGGEVDFASLQPKEI